MLRLTFCLEYTKCNCRNVLCPFGLCVCVENLNAVSVVSSTRTYFFNGKAKYCNTADTQEEGGFLLLHLLILYSAHFVTLAICFSI